MGGELDADTATMLDYRLAALTSQVRRVLDLTGVSLTIPPYPDVAEALRPDPDPAQPAAQQPPSGADPRPTTP